MDQVDAVVIGAGVVGLAVARALALAGHETLVLESQGRIGSGISSRNSEVIHAGIYYPAGSLKARLCVDGKKLLYAYCDAAGVPYRRCGKLLVATAPDQVAQMRSTQMRAQANGVDDLILLDRKQALEMEPALHCEAALLSPSTGIIDSHALMTSYQGDLENAGGNVVLQTPVQEVQLGSGSRPVHVVKTADGTLLGTSLLVNAAGLTAPALARSFIGLDASHVPLAYFAKGNYFTLAVRAPFHRLIYPLPQAAGLGVHLTLDLAGQAKFGPDVQWVQDPEDFSVDAERAASFYSEVRKYWPGLPDGALQPAYAGIRPKINAPTEAAADFCIQGPADHGVAGLVNLFGIESPGLTSSLAIGDHVAALFATP
jgi:L-2-hydroxyglutarate oxidase LhgO